MNRKRLSQFQKQELNTKIAAVCLGGAQTYGGFCDWYLDFTGNSPNPQAMQIFALWDSIYSNVQIIWDQITNDLSITYD